MHAEIKENTMHERGSMHVEIKMHLYWIIFRSIMKIAFKIVKALSIEYCEMYWKSNR